MFARCLFAAAAAALAFTPALAQQKKAEPKRSKAAPTGPKIRHQCKVGPYEKQTRLVMETVRDKPVYLAYWSSRGPFHCSFESWPGDGRAKWMDSSAGMVINLISGTMLIEKTGDKFLVHARDVDRMPYCGTFGLINGLLTVPTKKGSECDWKEIEPEEGGRLNSQPESEDDTKGQSTEAPSGSPVAAAPAPLK